MKDRLLHGWDLQRGLRAALAVVFLFAAISGRDPIAYGAAAFFGIQAVFNVGCCGASSCAPRAAKDATGNKH